jgi:hypothetical protein
LQFGAGGERLWDLSWGIDTSKLISHQRSPVLVEQLELDPPVQTVDHLLVGMGKLADRLAFQLGKRWQCCQRITAQFNFDEGNPMRIILDFKQPVSSGKEMLRYLEYRLEGIRFSNPVSGIRLSAEQLCAEQGAQIKLLDNLPRRRHDLLRAIRRLQARYGSPAIKRVVTSNVYTRLPERAFSFVDFA